MTAQFTTLFSFNGPNGLNPEGGLIVDPNGDLYGTTSGGGGGRGSVFELQNTGTVAAPVYASAPTTLVSFQYTSEGPYDGAIPNTRVVADANGNLFGTTFKGGAYGDWGTVFEIKNAGTSAAPVYATNPTTLVSFNYSNGGFPEGDLIVDTNGNLFGTTAEGGTSPDGSSAVWGTVFEIKNVGSLTAPVYADAPTTLVTFNGSNGRGPSAGLVADANGDLFGTTSGGGANGNGTVFEIKNIGTVAAPLWASAPTTLVSFDSTDGAGPLGSMIVDANGDLFGTTSGGGANGNGTVFEIKNIGTVAAPLWASAPTTLVSFDGSDGSGPYAGLIADANGDLFGTTESGGANGYGTVFEIKNIGTAAAPSYAGAPTTLASFTGSNGANPYAGLIADANGDLFGTTADGGANGDGTVFEITGACFVAAAPVTISGTISGQTTTSDAPVSPFAHVTIGDANAGATDTLTITLGGGGGMLSGTGVIGGVGGVYTLSGTPAAVTSELDALIFTPKAGAPYTSSTTTFTLSDQSSAGGGPAVDATTSVIDKDIAPPPAVVHPNNRPVEPNYLALSGDVRGAHNFIDTLNFVASYGDLISAFGTNQQAAQNWYNTQEPIEQRVETFDGLDYVASYGDLISAFKSGSKQAVLDAGASHFINSGVHEGRTTTFNGLDYIASYGDLINAFGANGDAGAYHYIENGASEGRKTTFDGLDYIASYGDLINALGANEQAGAAHFITNGFKEGRTTTFNGLDYIASYGDLIQAFGANNDAGATHYIEDGHNEGRTTTFDGLDYIASYGDLIKALGANEQAGAEHFIDNGYKEGRTTTFDGLDYIANYTDLMTAFGANNDAGATHYIDNGFSEGRSTSFNVGAYESAHPDLIGKFSSNDAFLTAYINTYKATGTFLT